jgi:hypothetical protein
MLIILLQVRCCDRQRRGKHRASTRTKGPARGRARICATETAAAVGRLTAWARPQHFAGLSRQKAGPSRGFEPKPSPHITTGRAIVIGFKCSEQIVSLIAKPAARPNFATGLRVLLASHRPQSIPCPVRHLHTKYVPEVQVRTAVSKTPNYFSFRFPRATDLFR